MEAARDPEGWWGETTKKYYPLMDPEEGCVNQLKKSGFSTDDVKFVLHSHLHLDHSGACGNFPKARHLVQRREIDWAFAADWFMKGGYIMNDLAKPGINWDIMEDEDQYDVFGDGACRILCRLAIRRATSPSWCGCPSRVRSCLRSMRLTRWTIGRRNACPAH